MRVASKTAYDMIQYNLASISKGMNEANEKVATGKNIIDLSDDPVRLTQSLQLQSSLASIDQLGRNIDLGSSWLTATESALTNVQDILSDAKVLTLQMASDTTGANERAASATTVQNMLDEVIALANTEVSGRYIFAGSMTNTAPFDSVGTYNGDNSPFSIRIGKGESFVVGNDGDAVFGTIFTTLSSLKTALETNDQDSILATVDNLDIEYDQITSAISDAGIRQSRLEIRENIFADLEITNTERYSKIADADIAEAITELKAKELAYQAALASSARVMQISLVNYID